MKTRLKHFLRTVLYQRYTLGLFFNETQIFLLGDGRVGKTSTKRTLFNRSFLADNSSTLVLDDTDIFAINPTHYNWTFLTKYELSVQRVKNNIPYDSSSPWDYNKKLGPSLDLSFVDELIERTVADESYVETMITGKPGYNTHETYFRVYDFGGQEVFSAIHPVFMNTGALYIMVFKLSAMKNIDLERMRFWCESVLRIVPDASILFVGTFLHRYMKKHNDEDLRLANELVETVIQKLSSVPVVVKNQGLLFFPLENGMGKQSKHISYIRKAITGFVSGETKGNVKSRPFLSCAFVLFFDYCREQSNYMSLKEFKKQTLDCKFKPDFTEKYLKIFSSTGLILHFPHLNLQDDQNFIFFSASWLAQALGSFIRDPTLHELAFRVTKKKFPFYRIYVDTGKIHRDLYNVLLKNYSQRERNFVLRLALETLILIKFDIDPSKEVYVVPGLLPKVNSQNINFVWRPIEELIFTLHFNLPMRLGYFEKVIIIFLKNNVSAQLLDHVLFFAGFARASVDIETQVDLYICSDRDIGFWIHGQYQREWFNQVLLHLVEEVTEALHEEVSLVISNEEGVAS
eukprot:snap_masked-scaffold_44-processed-gene-0.15-mRNA-1 protein AED:1.00 eAED:1.00 QI:0/0/0/0/1/1/2/0/571